MALGVDSSSTQAAPAPPPADIRSEQGSQPARPWPRFWARLIDLWLLGLLLAAIIGVGTFLYSPALFLVATDPKIIGFALLPLVGVVVALLMAAIGTTPGKAILGIRLKPVVTGSRLIFFLIRELKVWVFGLGLGIPFVALFTPIYQYTRVAGGKAASYDDGYCLVEGTPSPNRVLIGAACAIGLISILAYLQAADRTAPTVATKSWQNPITNQQAEIAESWGISELDARSSSGRAFYFDSAVLRTGVIFGYEQPPSDFDVERYAFTLQEVISSQIQITSDWQATTIDGQQALRATGTTPNQAWSHVEVTVIVNGRDAWRAMIFSESADPSSEKDNLVDALFSTID
ncbi:RDD family protein [Sinorhizobium psoraleae]|uniref:RDD family protein n=1 Tax=Sinorhizobium psoraleae TaxID=520838 RepID=A0ABT4KPE5_9HYPH|nr:RDD family protein [Sinorhizobium psoraleae]MCZ4093836.1 RDD family protein [Sinorhizobium psoraleae]